MSFNRGCLQSTCRYEQVTHASKWAVTSMWRIALIQLRSIRTQSTSFDFAQCRSLGQPELQFSAS